MKVITRCPACDSEDIAPLCGWEKFPAILFATDPAETDSIATGPLHIAACSNCGHMFASHIDEEFNRRLYADYYHLYPFSQLESMNALYRKPFERLFDYASADVDVGTRLLEIGCSDEAELDGFLAKGLECTGVSPGAKPSSRLTMIDAFYENQAFEKPFDLIVSRFNLEHIIDPGRFLLKVRSDLKTDGQFVVQVPNVENFLASGLINVFAHEHPQYFSHRSLELLLQRNGFECLVSRGADEPSLIFATRPIHGPQTSTVSMFERNIHSAEQIWNLMDAHPKARFVFYGAGLSLTSLLYSKDRPVGFEDRVRIVDDNKLLWGKCMPHSHVVIEAPSSELFDSGSIVILLLNAIYHARVLPKLKDAAVTAIYALTGGGLQEIENR